MLPLHTQKSLDALTWNEIQKLHTSLGLKSTAETRTRRDCQRRIVATQPQPVVESEAVVSPLTCAACPLARLIDGNRYCCKLTDSVVRGHWEANSDCYDAVAEAEAETETTEIVAEPEAPIAQIETAPQEIAITPAPIAPTAIGKNDKPPNCGDNGRGRVEAIAPAIASRVKIKQPPIWVYVPPDRVQETIVWKTPFKGEILGKSGYRRFFVENDVIYVILVNCTSTFCASESTSPNYHHKVIRQAIEVGKQFEPSAFKQRAKARGCPSPKYQTYWWKDGRDGRSCNLGQIYQNCDGWWWAWASQGDHREGCNFQTQIQAQKHLEIEKAITRQTEIAALATPATR